LDTTKSSCRNIVPISAKPVSLRCSNVLQNS
jgi:hypothetical protein